MGLLEVTSEPFKDKSPIWKDEDFPCRVRVKALATLTPETGIPVKDFSDRLTVFKGVSEGSPKSWTGHFRSSPSRWKASDGETVSNAILDAQKNPTVRPIDPAKLKYRPKAFHAKIGLVTVPDSHVDESPAPTRESTAHTDIQGTLLKLESRGCSDSCTEPEIESTTSIYSGLLRMADLVAMQPNLNIPLYLVAPDERRDKVFAEVNRPTFSRLSPKLAEICRFISFSALRDKLGRVQSFVRYLKPDFLDELSESCEVEGE